MNLVVSKPELSIQATESMFVVIPVSVEIFRPIEAFLEDYPSPTVRCLITKDIERPIVIRVDEIDAILLETFFKEVCAVTSLKGEKLWVNPLLKCLKGS